VHFVNFTAVFGEKTERWQLKFTLSKDSTKVIAGFHCIEEEAQLEQKRDELSTIVEAMAEDYECLFHADFDSGNEDHYRESEHFCRAIPGWEEETNYTKRMQLFAETLVVPEDRAKFRMETAADNVSRKLKENNGAYTILYRILLNGKTQWFQTKYVHHAAHVGHNCALIGFHNIDAEMKSTIERRETMVKSLEIIDILASDYITVFYVDLATGELTISKLGAAPDTDMEKITTFGAFCDYFMPRLPESEKKALAKITDLASLKTLLAKQQVYEKVFRFGTEQQFKYVNLRIVRVDNDEGDVHAAVFGIADRDAEIRLENETAAAQKRYYGIVKALSSEYGSIYYAELNSNLLIPYSNSRNIERRFGNNAFHSMTYSEGVQLYIEKGCAESDKANLAEILSPDFLKKHLAVLPYYTSTYQNSDGRYCEVKCVRAEESADVDAVVIGFADKDIEIRSREEAARETKRNFDIIQILASEYSSVYYIDLATDELNPYTMNEDTQSEFGQIFMSGIHYTDAYKMYVDRLIHDADKKMMLEAGSVKNIKARLADKKTFITTYRSAEGHYCEMKFVKVNGESEEPTAVALGFADKDEEIRSREKLARENKMNFDIIQILASEYSSVYYIDLATDELNPYTMNEDTESEFGQIFKSGIHYTDAYKLYVDRLIHDADKKMMLAAGSTENIKAQLAFKKTFLTTYRSADGHYCEMKFVKVNGEAQAPTAVALGFADKDEEIRSREKRARENKMNFDIIQILASEYSSVYYIDLQTDRLNPYTMNEDTQSEFGQIFKSGIRYSDAYKLYVDRLILAADKDRMLKAGSLPNILSQLAHKKTFITTYRSAEGHYCEMKFVKVDGENDLPTAVALGFADKDEVLRKEKEIETERERNFDIIQILASEYSSVYYIDLTTDELNPYTMNEDTESEFGQIFKSGIRYSDAYKMYVDRLIHEDDKEMMLKAGSSYNISRQLMDKKTFITTYRSADGHYCEMKFVKVNGESEMPTAVALGFADKDEEIRGEQLRKAQLEEARSRAEAASKAKSTFLFNMSHDIRTPMNAILGFTEMAKKHIDDRERVVDCLAKVTAAGDHLLRLINDVLDMSRIEAGKIVIDEKTTDIYEAVENITSMVNETAKANNITFTNTVNVTDSVVYADYLHINQIVLNIVSNAIKYTREGGSVSYSFTQVSEAKDGAAQYRMVVEDTGIGMTREFVDHIFEEFAREKNSTVSGIQGTGLGMSIVKRLVDMMQGSISIESELGKGTKVTVDLVLRVVENPLATVSRIRAPQEPEAVRLSGRHLLVVEDNEMNREIARDILEEQGIFVDEAEDGSFAVEILKEKGPAYFDCVLMDIQMPFMDGYKATQIIRAMKGFEHLPVIALSANAFEEDKKKSQDAGMDGHLSKPIVIEELVKMLSEVLGERE
ncbi:MAG TPA: response regulator, partial [Methanocorpusculum sp.]|nr:response regulator [Methanocorpusculum sp.]